MDQTPKPIFRPEAMAKFMDSQSSPVFPKFIGPRLFPKLWVLVAILVAAMLSLAWMPIAQTHQVSGRSVAINEPTGTMTLLLWDLEGIKVAIGEAVVWRSDRERTETGKVTSISPIFQNAAALQASYPHLDQTFNPDRWPVLIVKVQTSHPATAAILGRDLRITIQKPSKRFLDWLPIGAKGS